MFTKKLISPAVGLVSGLALGLLSSQASATEEVVVYGHSSVSAREAEAKALRLAVTEHVRAFNEQLKETLENDLKRVGAPKVQLAVGETATRS